MDFSLCETKNGELVSDAKPAESVQERVAAKLNAQLRHLKQEVIQVSDKLINSLMQIKVSAENGEVCTIKYIIYKESRDKSYSIFQAHSAEELNGCIHTLSDALEQMLGIPLYPLYDEETNWSQCNLHVAGTCVQLTFAYDGYLISLRAKETPENREVLDDFAVYLAVLLQERNPEQ